MQLAQLRLDVGGRGGEGALAETLCGAFGVDLDNVECDGVFLQHKVLRGGSRCVHLGLNRLVTDGRDGERRASSGQFEGIGAAVVGGCATLCTGGDRGGHDGSTRGVAHRASHRAL